MKNEKIEISNNTFNGVNWDAQSIQTIQTIADALLNMTKIFLSQNIELNSMLKIERDDVIKIHDNSIVK